MATATKKQKSIGWRDSYFVRVYELALSGASVHMICRALGIPRSVFGRWLAEKPALREAIAKARRPACKTNTDESTPDHKGIGQRFIDIMYRRLSPELQRIWDEIEDVTGGPMGDDPKKKPKNAGERIDRLFSVRGAKRARQSIWVAALVASNFSVLEACRKVNISIGTYEAWKSEPEFNEIFDQIKLAKKELLESKVWQSIDEQEPSILKWASECINADKGWVRPQRKNGELPAGVTLNMVVDVRSNDADLDKLSLEERIALRDKVRAQKAIEIQALPPAGETSNGITTS